MSETTMALSAPPEAPITLEDIRHKALHIRDEVRYEVTETVASRGAQMVAIGVVAAVAVIGLAYFMGSRAGRRAAEPPRY
jgi:hypothetical protein